MGALAPLSVQNVGSCHPAARVLPQGHVAIGIAQGHGAVGVVAAVLETDIARVTGRCIVRVEIRQVYQAIEGVCSRSSTAARSPTIMRCCPRKAWQTQTLPHSLPGSGMSCG